MRTVRPLLRDDKMCRERLHILSLWGDNVCRVRQNVPLKVHILSPATNCVGATKCAVTQPDSLHEHSLTEGQSSERVT